MRKRGRKVRHPDEIRCRTNKDFAGGEEAQGRHAPLKFDVMSKGPEQAPPRVG
jgi:hypothetical protein